MGRVRLSITIDENLAKEIEEYYRKAVIEAAQAGNVIPKISHVYERILKLGWEKLKKIEK